LYSSSSHLVFAEGSALNAYALVCDPSQQVFVIWRDIVRPSFPRQINSFGGNQVLGDSYKLAMWVPATAPLAIRGHGKVELDLGRLGESLRTHGFLPENVWINPSKERREQALNELQNGTVEWIMLDG
jgi:hypothetical protein